MGYWQLSKRPQMMNYYERNNRQPQQQQQRQNTMMALLDCHPPPLLTEIGSSVNGKKCTKIHHRYLQFRSKLNQYWYPPNQSAMHLRAN
jgi:hypothetical protein